MKSMDQVSNLINNLTSDEDKRQDLWLYYLKGNQIDGLVPYFDRIKKEDNIDKIIQQRVWIVANSSYSDKFYQILIRFSNIEQSIIILLALGLSVNEISEYKGIAEIRIRQVISTVRNSEHWKEMYGVEEKADSGRKIRS